MKDSKLADGIVADVGPRNGPGECSKTLADALGVPSGAEALTSSPATGTSPLRVSRSLFSKTAEEYTAETVDRWATANPQRPLCQCKRNEQPRRPDTLDCHFSCNKAFANCYKAYFGFQNYR
jgi:hypothetical protein